MIRRHMFWFTTSAPKGSFSQQANREMVRGLLVKATDTGNMWPAWWQGRPWWHDQTCDCSWCGSNEKQIKA